MELELSFSVETSSDLGLLMPTLRSVTFHKELYKAMELQERAERVSRMFSRLDSSIRSELTAIDIRDARTAGRRRRSWTFASNLLATIVVPVGVLLAFFGMGTSDVSSDFSFDSVEHYPIAYGIAGVIALLPLIAWGTAAAVTRRIERQEDDETRRRRQAAGVDDAASQPPSVGSRTDKAS
jgi:hypothetical protein